MKKLFIKSTQSTPEIHFSPDENIFIIKGNSSPEDVRALYYPVTDWIKIFVDDVIEGEYHAFSEVNPIRFQVDLEYFNSSSAKFLFDIFSEIKRINESPVPIVVEWHFDPDDPDSKEAGLDIAALAGMEFSFIPHPE